MTFTWSVVFVIFQNLEPNRMGVGTIMVFMPASKSEFPASRKRWYWVPVSSVCSFSRHIGPLDITVTFL